MEAQLVSILAPYLAVLAGGATKKVGELAGGAGWDLAQKVWATLRPAVEAKSAAREAVDDVAEHPDDEDLQAALRVQIRKILEADPSLASDLGSMVQGSAPDVSASGPGATASGSVNAGRDAAGRDMTKIIQE